jgi:hypothetical protein
MQTANAAEVQSKTLAPARIGAGISSRGLGWAGEAFSLAGGNLISRKHGSVEQDAHGAGGPAPARIVRPFHPRMAAAAFARDKTRQGRTSFIAAEALETHRRIGSRHERGD